MNPPIHCRESGGPCFTTTLGHYFELVPDLAGRNAKVMLAAHGRLGGGPILIDMDYTTLDGDELYHMTYYAYCAGK